MCGIYLLLSGCGRFVEEAYRGEPQTRVLAGLRFYQWIAIACVVAGAAITCVRGSAPLPAFAMRPGSVVLALSLRRVDVVRQRSGLSGIEPTLRAAHVTGSPRVAMFGLGFADCRPRQPIRPFPPTGTPLRSRPYSRSRLRAAPAISPPSRTAFENVISLDGVLIRGRETPRSRCPCRRCRRSRR